MLSSIYMEQKITISQITNLLGVNIQTLRRWDAKGKLQPLSERKGGHRYYEPSVVAEFLRQNWKYLWRVARLWAGAKQPLVPPPDFYCQNSSIFKARLMSLEQKLAATEELKNIFSVITAVTGEIGNNSFDHNLGNWPDQPGTFFGYSPTEQKIVLADRGQGVLTTLKRVRPQLADDAQALQTAFTEIISGRAPENRGNGLKFVKQIVDDERNGVEIFFESGNAAATINSKNGLVIRPTDKPIPGCLALIQFELK